MKELEISEYPDSLIEATFAFLNNPELLSVFITIIFKKTNAYDTNTLCATIDLVTKWILFIEKIGEHIPSDFDYAFYFKGIYMALDMEHSVSTPKVLFCLYQTMHLYPLEERNKLVFEILKKYHFKLFYSWSYNIRDIYFGFLLYQIEFNFIIKTSSMFDSEVNAST